MSKVTKMADTKSHHKKASFCASRPKYREARWERAVKVYTINLESKYLLVQGVPALGVTKDLMETFAIYGIIDEYRILDDYPAEEFTNVYWIKFRHIMAARKAKKKLDNRSFFGGVLHVGYAPEFETFHETREKLMDRKSSIVRKLKSLERNGEGQNAEQRKPQTKQHSSEGQTDLSHSRQPTECQQGLLTQTKTTSPQTPRSEKVGVTNTGPPTSTTEVLDSQDDKYRNLPTQLPLLMAYSYPSQTPTASITWNQPLAMTNLPNNVSHIVSEHHTQPHLENNVSPVSTKRKGYGKEAVYGPSVKRADASARLSSEQTLTGNSSMDRTVLSIREKLNRIKNAQSDSIATEQNPKRTCDLTAGPKEEKKKQRKRI